MSGTLSWGGFSLDGITDIISTNPTETTVCLVAFVTVVVGVTYFCSNRTNQSQKAQKQRDTLRYQNPSEQRISGSTIGADAQVRQRMFNSAKEPGKQTIEDAQIRTRAKVNQNM